jgi:hypothetical protein
MSSRDAKSWLRCIATVCIALLALGSAPAQETQMRATVDAPATVPVLAAPPTLTANRGPSQVVVTVTGYQPSPSGPVQAVVEARCGTAQKEIGRFGIMSPTAFSATDTARIQRFSLPLGPDAACKRPDSVTIRLVPSSGDGRGATIEIGSAQLK